MIIRKNILSLFVILVLLLTSFLLWYRNWQEGKYQVKLEDEYQNEFSNIKNFTDIKCYQEMLDSEVGLSFIEIVKEFSYTSCLFLDVPETRDSNLAAYSRDVYFRLLKITIEEPQYINGFLTILTNANINSGFSNTIRNFGMGYSSIKKTISNNETQIDKNVLNAFIDSLPDESRFLLSLFKQNELLNEGQNYKKLYLAFRKFKENDMNFDESIRIMEQVKFVSMDEDLFMKNLEDYYYLKSLKVTN